MAGRCSVGRQGRPHYWRQTQRFKKISNWFQVVRCDIFLSTFIGAACSTCIFACLLDLMPVLITCWHHVSPHFINLIFLICLFVVVAFDQSNFAQLTDFAGAPQCRHCTVVVGIHIYAVWITTLKTSSCWTVYKLWLKFWILRFSCTTA